MQELIRIGLAENKDLKIAVERIEEARATYGFVKSDLYPQVDVNASAAQPGNEQRQRDQVATRHRHVNSLFTN